MEHLPAVVGFVEQACRDARVGEDVAMAVRLAVEEVFTNIVQHGYPDGPGPVVIGVATGVKGVTITVRDEGVPFDPAEAPAPDLESGWEERPIGGLGWHLVRQLVDEVHHRHGPGGGNVVTLIKRLPQGGPDPGAAYGSGNSGRAA